MNAPLVDSLFNKEVAVPGRCPPIYGLNVLAQHPLLAFDGNLVDRGLLVLVRLLVCVEGGLALLWPLADRARSWAESYMNP